MTTDSVCVDVQCASYLPAKLSAGPCSSLLSSSR